ncbi:GNAT family N-acetyltransferase [cf. Phormidesmis sp. LEGE 11477]|uniref:GNAT family N-acetyltransferase n=1 Tax=cf. Phormidesmis sp. LEGE 11477 TaxID=1828680 RepID=UPI001880B0ED|nr:GNAT family N-acetyltransferase [cf. Phormidesmis sp. LEGE 11477]MBE9062904.1 GNAT family N-acetyltransferase [cf. Phormidesmis sp. LEGE 11477]
MITYSERRDISIEQILPIYELNGWSAAQKPDALRQALLNSHSLISAWNSEQLVGIGNAISDGFLVVYYPHLLVHPDYQQQGIGGKIMELLAKNYEGMHMQMLVAEYETTAFYQKCGFERAGKTESMWIYAGEDH